MARHPGAGIDLDGGRTVLEIRTGIELLATGRRRDALEHAFGSMLAEELQGRVLPFDTLYESFPRGTDEPESAGPSAVYARLNERAQQG